MIKYSKYSSCGNDFIIVDNRKNIFPINNQYIEELCDRKNGIGADGLILLSLADNCCYNITYFNSDGHESTFCGNGSMCCGHFAFTLGLLNNKNTGEGLFKTNEGFFKVNVNLAREFGEVSISMIDVLNVQEFGDNILMNTGSPHYLIFVSDVNIIDVESKGRAIRNSPQFLNDGVNVTFISNLNDQIFIRTYERGVEAETLSCGTGAVASALFLRIKKMINYNTILINTKGGLLKVSFKYEDNKFTNISLTSSLVVKMFDGVLTK